MKKILSIALVALLAVSAVFADFSGDASVALGYNWETGAYGFTNGTGLNFDIDLATADTEKIAEGSVYAGIKANFGVKVANWKVEDGVEYPEFGAALPAVKDGFEKAGLGVFAEVEEAYVAGENWKLSILGTKGAPDYAKSAVETKKDDVRDVFGNKYDTKDVPVTFKVPANDLAGVSAEVFGWTASFGFVGNSGEAQYGDKKEKSFDYNAFLETPEFDFGVVSLQAAAIASSGAKYDLSNLYSVIGGDELDSFKLITENAIGTSVKVGFDADILTGSVALDYGISNSKSFEASKDDDVEIGDIENLDDRWFQTIDVAANLAITPVTFDMYYAFNNSFIEFVKLGATDVEIPSEVKLGSNFLSAQVKADLAAFNIPVSVTVYGKNMLATKGDAAELSKVLFDKDGQDFGGKVAVNLGAIEVSADAGFVCSTEKFYLGADVAYTHDLFTVKAGADWSIMTAADKDNNVLAVNASIESSAIIPGATLSLAYGAADEDMNLLDNQINSAVKAQNLGKVEAKCKIAF